MTLPTGPNTLATLAGSETLTNKTITAPILGGTITTATGTNLVIQPATNVLEVRGDGSSVVGKLQLNCHNNNHGQKIASQPHSLGASNTLTLPGGEDAVLVSDTGVQTLTNKTITTIGLLTANSNVFVNADASFNQRLYVASDVSFNRNFQVFGKSVLNNDVSLNGRLSVGFDVSFGGRLFLPLDSIYAGGSLFVGGGGGGLSATGDVSMNNRLFVVGDVSFSNRLFLTSDASLNRNLFVNGTVAIGRPTVTSGFAVDVNGGIQATNYNLLSDYRIKTNVQELDGTFHVDDLRPVSYYNTVANKQDIGLIAHEIQHYYPYLVHGEKDAVDYQSVNYTGIIGLLIHEIQELKKRVKELEELENRP